MSWPKRAGYVFAGLVSTAGLLAVVLAAGLALPVGTAGVWNSDLGVGLGGAISLSLLLLLAFGLARIPRVPGSKIAGALASLMSLFWAIASPVALGKELLGSDMSGTVLGVFVGMILASVVGVVIDSLGRLPGHSSHQGAPADGGGFVAGNGGLGGGFFGGPGDGGGGGC